MSIPNNSLERQSTIARFDPIENSWTKLGNLQVNRRGHGVIQVDNEFIVVGGDVKRKSESCKLNRQSMKMKCTPRQPDLTKFKNYPELMLIP